MGQNRGMGLAPVALGVALAACGGDDAVAAEEPIKIGVLLSISGEADIGYVTPLEWARENVNRAGGVAGRPLQFVYQDVGVMDAEEGAEALLEDPGVVAVIGTDDSTDTFALASRFVAAKKPLVSPVATSADIFRAFSGKKYIWRTVESDVAQLRTMFLVALRDGHQKVALVTPTNAYGATFFDWFGFFATELGLEVTAIVQYDPDEEDGEEPMTEAFASEPEVLLAIPSDPQLSATMASMAYRHRAEGGTVRVLFSDGAYFPLLVDELGEEAEGMTGMSMSYDPDGGFRYAHAKRFGFDPSPFAANCYDAVSLIAYGLERSGGQGGEALADAMVEVVDARGKRTEWDAEGIADALAAIRTGALPDINGATGPLTFDAERHTDPASSIYARWEIENGQRRVREYFASDSNREVGSQSSLAILQSLASDERRQDLAGGGGLAVGERTGLWAFVASTSSGWRDYRHQADALGAYRGLKDRGLPDDRIVLVLADDLAYAEENPLPGLVRNEPGGPNLYEGVDVDHRLVNVDVAMFLDIMSGRAPQGAVGSTASDDLYVYIVGHGAKEGIPLGDELITPTEFASTFQRMHDQGRYRRALVQIEACFGGVMCRELDAPNVVLFAAANPVENSIGANYDPEVEAWLADQFSHAFSRHAASGNIDLLSLYESLYHSVRGSHVTVCNHGRFANLDEVSLLDFLAP